MRIFIQSLCVVAMFAVIASPRIAAAELTDADLKRMRAEKRVALVTGDSRYRNFQALDNPANDANGVATALREAGLKVILKLDATCEDMTQSLDAFDAALAQADVALFYYAGHAAQVDWRNFILPVAASFDVKRDNLAGQVAQEAMDLAEVLQRMERADKRLNIVILDAWRDNPFVAQAKEMSRSVSRSTGKTPFNVGTGANGVREWCQVCKIAKLHQHPR